MSEEPASGPVSFSLVDGELAVCDEAGGGALAVGVDEAASLTPATDAWFDVPVDDAVSLETTSFELRGGTSVQIRRAGGEHRGSLTDGEFTLPGETYVDVDAALKLLVYVDDAVTGRLTRDDEGLDSVCLRTDEPTRIVVGARSFHEAPIATMTVTNDPADMMAAASRLGSSIKEWSAERSWPTLRGHPPAIEHGQTLGIPDSLSIPDTDVTVVVPPNTADVLRVTPLAHYFGAEVVPGDRAELHLGSQYVEPLGEGAAIEGSVDTLLGHALVLDSLVRIGGYYSLTRHEYDELAPELHFYPPELYDEPIHRQLLEYLEVPFETVRPFVPDWPAVGTLGPTAADAEAIPYLLNTLARVHVTDDGIPRDPVADLEPPVHLSTSADVPRNVASLPSVARERTAAHERRAVSDASMLFVGTDRPATDRFDAIDWERFDVDGAPTATYRPAVTRAELRSLLTEPFAHVHYGGRVTRTGLVCDDGVLPFDDLPEGTVGSISFRWGRQSTAQLTPFLDTASVVCLTDDALSLETAGALAVYLSIGRSVASSARIAGVDGVRFLGDPTLTATRRSAGNPPFIAQVTRVGNDEYEVAVEIETDETDPIGQVGGVRYPTAPDSHQLVGTRQAFPQSLSGAELREFLRTDHVFRFDWRPDDDRSSSTPAVDDVLPE